MTWLIWRLHRTHAVVCLIAFATLATALVVTGLVMHHAYDVAVAGCGSAGNCNDLSNSLFQGDGLIIDVVAATMAAPLLLGIFWGAPLVAAEFEEHTGDLVWAQTVTRRRWMASNLTQALLVAAAWGGAVTLLVGWWRGPENALNGALPTGAFDIQGVVPIAYSVFAMALGVACGVFFRRTLTAIATTLVGFVGVRVVVVELVRPHFMTALTRTASLNSRTFPISGRAWLISKHVVNASGDIVDRGPISGPNSWLPSVCRRLGLSDSDRLSRCLAQRGYHLIVAYQPPSRFWAFQGIEAALFVAMAAGLSMLAFHRLVSRDA